MNIPKKLLRSKRNKVEFLLKGGFMGLNDFMAKVRYWDNRSAKWMMRHFYILFFEIFLVSIFVWCFINNLHLIDIGSSLSQGSLIERLILTQTVNSVIVIILLMLNSFWMLFIFGNMLRFRSLLKEISFHVSKRK